jgi:CIC family chloride channel protein
MVGANYAGAGPSQQTGPMRLPTLKQQDGPPVRAALWLAAVAVGVAAGYAAVGFRLGIAMLQTQLYGADDETIHSAAADLNPLVVIAIPIAGAAAVGWLLSRYTENGRALGVADAIEASALHDGRVRLREGCASAGAALITLSTGGSSGREGPVVHFGAVISTWLSERLDLHGVAARDLLGCAVASAVSASFNAPIAGALFALEVVLRHYAVHAFGPIVLAAVAGAVISRVHLGDVTEFILPPPTPVFYAEIPAFALLGVVCGFVAVAMMRAVFLAERIGDRVQRRYGLSPVRRAMAAGAALGVTATLFPHIIGVGYETTSRALTANLDFWTCVVFAVVKTLAVGATFAGRLGGGVFSPSLMLGALTGAAFGIVAIGLAPAQAGSEGLYAIAGAGAVASAVLGASISTSLIVFELTGDYRAAIAVMVSVALATAVAHRFVRKSFFLTQLANAGVALAAGPQSWLPRTIMVRRLMRPQNSEDGMAASAAAALIDQGAYLTRADTLALAMPMFDRMRCPCLPVVDLQPDDAPELVGALYHIDALRAINRVLVETHHEEHS